MATLIHRNARWLVPCLMLAGGCGPSSRAPAARDAQNGVDAPADADKVAARPESEVNVIGMPRFGKQEDGTVRGYLDAHTHLMSNVGFGGSMVCGETFHKDGAAKALQDCDYHKPHGHGALLENLTHRAGKGPLDGHDPVGWPTFKDWPSSESLTHQQMYYKWVERSWRSGQRIMVQHMVNNDVLCSIPAQPNKHACDDMTNVRLQVEETRKLEAYIDAEHGGPGQGWFRIVESAKQAREVVEQGKLAVVLGVEVSAPFGCSYRRDKGAQCDKKDIDRGLDEMYDLGIRSMFLCHKFDNALCGVRFDEGARGNLINVGNFINTGSWWEVQACKGEAADHTVSSLFMGGPATRAFPDLENFPVYGPGPHCNPRGLTKLGAYALRGLMERGMIVELDHMSVKATERSFEILEKAKYSAAISSHSWMSPVFYERLYKLGGMVAQYGHDAGEFVEKMQETRPLFEASGGGYAFGMDMNGMGGTPRPPREQDPRVSYPFEADEGVLVDRQTTGERVWDYNRDGVAHYGMIPDWLENIRQIGGQALLEELAKSSEKYLRMWATVEGEPEGDKPEEEKPGEGQPEAGESGADESGAGKPDEGKPGADEPGAGEPDEGKPSADEPGAGKPDAEKPDAEKPGAGKPGAEKPEAGEPGTDDPGSGKPGAGKPGAEKPEAGEPGADNPGAGKPDAGKPGTDEPDAGKPGAEKPEAGEPGAGKPDANNPEAG